MSLSFGNNRGPMDFALVVTQMLRGGQRTKSWRHAVFAISKCSIKTIMTTIIRQSSPAKCRGRPVQHILDGSLALKEMFYISEFFPHRTFCGTCSRVSNSSLKRFRVNKLSWFVTKGDIPPFRKRFLMRSLSLFDLVVTFWTSSSFRCRCSSITSCKNKNTCLQSSQQAMASQDFIRHSFGNAGKTGWCARPLPLLVACRAGSSLTS